MEISSPFKTPSVKNILNRHSCPNPDHLGKNNYQHPEKFHILKYFPKYYHGLTLEISSQKPLLSKLKRVKKLKRFTGHVESNIPQALWFSLLGSNRKEIEEIPRISYRKPRDELSPVFWKRFARQKLQFFLGLKRLLLPCVKIMDVMSDFDNFWTIKESLMKYIGNMKSLRSLKITLTPQNYKWVKWVLKKLNGMPRLFGRLKALSFDVQTGNKNIQELFNDNKKVFSHLTGLSLSVGFDPIFCSISEICLSLRFLAMNFQFSMNQKIDDFLQFLTNIQSLAHLRSLEFHWPNKIRYFWNHFKPQASLRYLKLSLNGSDLVREELFQEDVDPFENWEFIQELDGLQLFICGCQDEKEMNLVKLFITTVLNQIYKLRSLKCSIYATKVVPPYEPFSVEEVPHLYESLERFEHNLSTWLPGKGSSKFDLEMLRPFKNLKELKLDGNAISYENVEDMVSLLEGNQKERDYPMFGLKLIDSDLVRETLIQIQKAKKEQSNLKMTIKIECQTSQLVGLFEKLCADIQTIEIIKGLVLDLSLNDKTSSSQIPAEDVSKILKKYPGIRNLKVLLSNYGGSITFIKMDREKEQFIDDFDIY